MKRVGWLVGVLLVLTAVVTICFVNATNNSIHIELTDSTGEPITTALPNSKVFVNIWTFDENGSIVNLQSEELKAGSNTITLNDNTIQKVKEFAKKRGSLTAFIGVDLWIEKDGKVYTFPPESLEISLTKNIPSKIFKLKINLKEARVTNVKQIGEISIKEKGKITPLIGGHWYEWRTVRERTFQNVKIPILIIHNNVLSDVFGTADIAVQVQKYWGSRRYGSFWQPNIQKSNL